MSGVRAFFRHCPECGRRFEIRLVGKKKIEEHSEGFREKLGKRMVNLNRRLLLLEEAKPTIADVEVFDYSYRCRHCGHQWIEIHERDDTEPEPRGYTGD
jgi:hypothetical protein